MPRKLKTRISDAKRELSHSIHQSKGVFFFVKFTDIMEEELFAQFNKIANSILHSKSKEQRTAVEAGPQNENTRQRPEKEREVKTKCCKPSGVSPETTTPALKVKALQVNILMRREEWFKEEGEWAEKIREEGETIKTRRKKRPKKVRRRKKNDLHC